MIQTQVRHRYASDLSDTEWRLIQPLLPPEKSRGRQREVDEREILNAIFYLNDEGCTWRGLPKDFPPWPTVYKYFLRWQRLAIWQTINDTLRAKVRATVDKAPHPTAGIIDSQSVKTTEKRGKCMAMTAENLVIGRKRHLLVDTHGLV